MAIADHLYVFADSSATVGTGYVSVFDPDSGVAINIDLAEIDAFIAGAINPTEALKMNIGIRAALGGGFTTTRNPDGTPSAAFLAFINMHSFKSTQ